MRRLEAWLHHEQLKSTGYAAPALEYLAWVPWIGRSGCKKHLSIGSLGERPEREREVISVTLLWLSIFLLRPG